MGRHVGKKFDKQEPEGKTKGSRKNKFAILSVEVPGWQGARALAYQDMASFRNAARRDASALKI
jgi:hypothetical protein